MAHIAPQTEIVAPKYKGWHKLGSLSTDWKPGGDELEVHRREWVGESDGKGVCEWGGESDGEGVRERGGESLGGRRK